MSVVEVIPMYFGTVQHNNHTFSHLETMIKNTIKVMMETIMETIVSRNDTLPRVADAAILFVISRFCSMQALTGA